MSLFKKKEKSETSCCCGGSCTPDDLKKAEETKTAGARIKILGTGCSKCKALEASAEDALTDMGLDLPVDHVTDFAQISAYGVMTTPALVVDGKVVSYGKVLSKDEVRELFEKLL